MSGLQGVPGGAVVVLSCFPMLQMAQLFSGVRNLFRFLGGQVPLGLLGLICEAWQPVWPGLADDGRVDGVCSSAASARM